MKLRSPFALPPFDRTSRLPLLLAALLATAFAIQLTAAHDVDLPDPGPIGGVATAARPKPRPIPATGGSAIVARSMFAPGASRLAAGAAPPGGIAIVGSIRIGRADFAVVRGPGSRTAYVRPGGRIGDWRLRGLTRSEALLLRGEERLTVPFGGRDVPVASAAAGEKQ